MQFFTKLKQCSNDAEMLLISEEDVWNAIMHQKKGKAMGPDGVAMEAYLLGDNVLCQYLCAFFNTCLKHNYLPASFMVSTIVPLVKNKCGDLTDLNKYRAITLSNSIIKILETIV